MHIFINDLVPLLNVFDDIVAQDVDYFNDEDIDNLFEEAVHLLDEYIQLCPHIVSEPDFEQTLLSEIKELMETPWTNDLFYDEDAEDALEEIIEIAFQYYFDTIMPARSQTEPIAIQPTIGVPEVTQQSNPISIDAEERKRKLAKQIDILRSKPQPTQRTPEWYTFRHNLITASNAHKAFETQSSKNQLIYEKCLPLKMSDDKKQRVNVNSPMHWGQKYEPISVKYYEETYGTTVEDFGCIQHEKYPFLGASPDGIIVDPDSPNYGRMLEIKNPVSREITGIPKKEYWIQMQLQMETCDLDECDFLETKFVEYESLSKFNEDGDFLKSKEGCLKGVMLYFSDADNYPHYVHKPLQMDSEEFDMWEEKMMTLYEEEKNMVWIKNNYWKLEQVSCVLVLRNRPWFEMNIGALKELWDTVEKERADGYSHRAPKQKPVASDSVPNQNIMAYFAVNKLDATTPSEPIPDVTAQLPIQIENCPDGKKTILMSPILTFDATKRPGASGCLLHFKKDKDTGEVTVVKNQS